MKAKSCYWSVLCFLFACWTEAIDETLRVACIELWLQWLFSSHPLQTHPNVSPSCQGDHQAKQGHLHSKAPSNVSVLSWTSPANSMSTITDITEMTRGLSLSPGHEVPHHSYLSAHVPQMLLRCFKKYGGKTCTIQRGPWTVCGVGVGLLVCYCPRTMQQVLFLLPSVLLLCILKLSLAAFITAVGWLSSRSELLSGHPWCHITVRIVLRFCVEATTPCCSYSHSHTHTY